MKKILFTITVFLLLIASVNTYAQTIITTSNVKITKQVIDNLLVGLQSDNLGLRVSCAYYLGEYNSAEAVIPLMNMLHSEQSEEARIVAALALIKISSDKAHYAVKEAAQMDDSQRVRKLCARFYDALYNTNYSATL